MGILWDGPSALPVSELLADQVDSPLPDNGIVFHAGYRNASARGGGAIGHVVHHSLAHAEHPINLGDAQPVQDIRHQSLEAHILDPRDVLGPLEVIRCAIFPALASVVHDCRSLLDGQ